MIRHFLVLSLSTLTIIACGSSSSTTTGTHDAGTHDGAKPAVDAHKGADTGSKEDAKSGHDAHVHADTGPGDSGLAPGQCRTDSDCGAGVGTGCFHYTLPAFCSEVDAGALFSGAMCTTNAECADAGPNAVCGTQCRVFTGGAEVSTCALGCTKDSDCAPAGACNAAHACVAATCTTASDCGTNYTCTSGSCAEKPCTEDSQCDGYCVESYAAWRALTGAKTCSPTLGTCTQRAA